ncbi:Phosphoenolpyruvate synthase regulatory protein [Candidatus Syntrophocurvum alkaliphilum]|uniref:Phosphoenolpyruvate synthase regulatory protein n=1 Tax=Candidatus Syntrophocurvum alkaliphilum TaxID=2293317 RepID=A0A6I6DLB1_9FIRM|nr:pyruvate, water dikinase regulatory protein [Candidatus Syntrophocurvum alkaliphilum]QGU00215.1 Phosphoenolpyruvate synthase regulatory protein [Candidatus Syntrophocurvum alkaliphilum]
MEEKIHVFAVSDSVGETAERIAVASAIQFAIDRNITRFSRVNKEEKVEDVVEKAVKEDAIIVYTLIKPQLSRLMDEKANEKGIIAINALEPLLEAIKDKTNLEPSYKTGLMHQKDEHYFNRIEAIEWTIDHDNGQNLETIHEADLIILGLQRTSKTPLSTHLANLGLKVANFNIELEKDIPDEIIALKGKVPMVGLTIDPDTLIELRKEKFESCDLPVDIDSLEQLVAEELDNAYRIYKKFKCLVIDVTLDDIEEIGNTITHKFKLPLKVSHSRL